MGGPATVESYFVFCVASENYVTVVPRHFNRVKLIHKRWDTIRPHV